MCARNKHERGASSGVVSWERGREGREMGGTENGGGEGRRRLPHFPMARQHEFRRLAERHLKSTVMMFRMNPQKKLGVRHASVKLG